MDSPQTERRLEKLNSERSFESLRAFPRPRRSWAMQVEANLADRGRFPKGESRLVLVVVEAANAGRGVAVGQQPPVPNTGT